jgi:hypothetical protein
MPPPNEFKISFTIDLNPYVAGLKSMLGMTQEAGKQIQPLLNMQMAAPDFSPFEKQLISLQEEIKQMMGAEAGASGTTDQLSDAERKAAEEAKRLADEQKKTGRSTDGMSDSFQKAFFAINVIQQSYGILRNFYGGLIRDSNDAEKQTVKLTAALNAQDGATELDREQMIALASAYSEITGIDDDVIVGAEAMLTAYTGLRGKAIEPALRAVLDLSSALDTDLSNAAMQMGRIVEFGIGKIRNLPIDLSKISDESERWDKLIQLVDTHFGGFAQTVASTDEGL